jgi:hypothetical protein
MNGEVGAAGSLVSHFCSSQRKGKSKGELRRHDGERKARVRAELSRLLKGVRRREQVREMVVVRGDVYCRRPGRWREEREGKERSGKRRPKGYHGNWVGLRKERGREVGRRRGAGPPGWKGKGARE